MSGRILRFDDSAHREADALLPWLVNGTLGESERATVEQHVRECARCRRELDMLQQLRAWCAQAGPAPDASAPYLRLAARIERRDRFPRLAGRLLRLVRPEGRAPGWARWALLGQFVALIGVGAWIAAQRAESPALYQTLGAPASRSVPAGSITVVFAPQLAESGMRSILQAAGARIVDGPTESRAYVLQVPAGQRERALAALRADPGVLLAEPLSALPDR